MEIHRIEKEFLNYILLRVRANVQRWSVALEDAEFILCKCCKWGAWRLRIWIAAEGVSVAPDVLVPLYNEHLVTE